MKMFKDIKKKFLIGCSLLLLTVSCNHTSKSHKFSEKVLLQKIKKAQSKKNWRSSLELIENLMQKSLNPKAIQQALFFKARSEFFSKDYKKSYNTYINLYKKNPAGKRGEEALFFAAMSLFRESPRSPEKDQSLSKEAIKLFKKYIQLFPKGSHKSKSLKSKLKLENKLKEADFVRAKFYIRKKKNKIALLTLKKLKKQQPNKKLKKQILETEKSLLKQMR